MSDFTHFFDLLFLGDCKKTRDSKFYPLSPIENKGFDTNLLKKIEKATESNRAMLIPGPSPKIYNKTKVKISYWYNKISIKRWRDMTKIKPFGLKTFKLTTVLGRILKLDMSIDQILFNTISMFYLLFFFKNF